MMRFASILLAGLMAALPARAQESAQMHTHHGAPDGASMVDAAQDFLNTLDEEQRARAVFPFEDDERYDFNFTPIPRDGLPIADMTMDQIRAVHALLHSALSSQGYLKATSVMQLEYVLRTIESPRWHRDPELYYVSVFGTPTEGEPWGWRFEGHHLSLNYTSVTDELTATTPAFFGSNPAEVRAGEMTGLRVLGEEDDLGMHLMAALDPGQRQTAIVTDNPRGMITGNDREAQLESFQGVAAADMSAGQRDLLWAIVEEYVRNARPDLAEEQLAKIDAAGFDKIYFAWGGSPNFGEPHYYRVHGPTILIEFDNTQGDGNHIHSVMRDLTNDWGEDILREHYDEHDHN